MQFLCELCKILVKTFSVYRGKSCAIYIEQVFILQLVDHPLEWKYCWRGRILHDVCYFSYLSTILELLMPDLRNMNCDYGNTFEIFLKPPISMKVRIQGFYPKVQFLCKL